MSEIRNLYVSLAQRVAAFARTPDELNEWWRAESERRQHYGIVKGTPGWDAIVEACAVHKAELLLGTQSRGL